MPGSQVEELGSGGFGTAYKWQNGDQYYATKCFHSNKPGAAEKDIINTNKALEALKNDTNNLSTRTVLLTNEKEISDKFKKTINNLPNEEKEKYNNCTTDEVLSSSAGKFVGDIHGGLHIKMRMHLNNNPAYITTFIKDTIESMYHVANKLKKKQLYHSDFKGENMFLAFNGTELLSRVGDFGLTSDGKSYAGTPVYMGIVVNASYDGDMNDVINYIENGLAPKDFKRFRYDNHLIKAFRDPWHRTLFSIIMTLWDLFLTVRPITKDDKLLEPIVANMNYLAEQIVLNKQDKPDIEFDDGGNVLQRFVQTYNGVPRDALSSSIQKMLDEVKAMIAEQEKAAQEAEKAEKAAQEAENVINSSSDSEALAAAAREAEAKRQAAEKALQKANTDYKTASKNYHKKGFAAFFNCLKPQVKGGRRARSTGGNSYSILVQGLTRLVHRLQTAYITHETVNLYVHNVYMVVLNADMFKATEFIEFAPGTPATPPAPELSPGQVPEAAPASIQSTAADDMPTETAPSPPPPAPPPAPAPAPSPQPPAEGGKPAGWAGWAGVAAGAAVTLVAALLPR